MLETVNPLYLSIINIFNLKLNRIMQDFDKKLKELWDGFNDEFQKFKNGNQAAGTRARGFLQDIKKVAQEARTAIQEKKKVAQEARAAMQEKKKKK